MDEVDNVHCAKCGHPIPEPPGLPAEERMPCPECSSTTRRFSKTLTAAVSVRAFLDGKRKSPEFPWEKKGSRSPASRRSGRTQDRKMGVQGTQGRQRCFPCLVLRAHH
jgi:DNA-directed RNA polymerase subunit RPC12/RpoP